jgi:hypothetical protein
VKKKTILKLLCVEKSWLQFNPSLPSIVPSLEENINFIPNLKFGDVAGIGLHAVARWLIMTIQLIPHLQ